MKRWFAGLLALALMLGVTGCGSSQSATAATDVAVSHSGMGEADYGTEVQAVETADAAGEEAYDSENPSDSSGDTQNVQNNANVKLVYTGSLTVEVMDFDAATDSVTQLVEQCGGYFEQKNLDQGSYDSSYRSSYFVIRVPADQYRSFMDKVAETENCHVVSSNESVEDIGEQYFDAETRLATLNTKLERLQALLKEAKKMEDIISLESAISDTEYEIEQYTTTLNHYDSLVHYSTVYLTLSRVVVLSTGDDQTLGTRMKSAFSSGVEAFLSGLGDLAVWLAGNVLGIVVVLVLAILIVLIVRFSRKRAAERIRKMPRRATGHAAVPPPFVGQETPVTPEQEQPEQEQTK